SARSWTPSLRASPAPACASATRSQPEIRTVQPTGMSGGLESERSGTPARSWAIHRSRAVFVAQWADRSTAAARRRRTDDNVGGPVLMSQAMWGPGTIVADKYRLGPVLGRGGMGMVVEALHVQLGTSFALKFLYSSILAKRSLAERFFREARATAALKSE